MAIGGRLIDGTVGGYTGAQYANAAYRVDNKWQNNAEIKDGGTVRVMKNKVIKEGDEILFAYHSNYWSRWGKHTSKRRGRPRKSNTSIRPARPMDDSITTAPVSSVQQSHSVVAIEPPAIATDGGGHGRRVAATLPPPPTAPTPRSEPPYPHPTPHPRRKRKTPEERQAPTHATARRKRARRQQMLNWTDTVREEYVR